MKKIVMIDDDPDDQIFYGRLFKEVDPELSFETFHSILDFLNQYEESQDLPALVLLDLNIPKVSGLEFIKQSVGQEFLSKIPFLVLTTSSSPMDMHDCRCAGVQAYFVKPADYEECKDLVNNIYQYWFKHNCLTNGGKNVQQGN